MKYIIVSLIVALMGFTLPVFAEDGANLADQLGDVFSGKGNSYAGIEITNIPLIELVTLKAWADCLIGEIDEGIKRDVRGGVRIVIDWEELFK